MRIHGFGWVVIAIMAIASLCNNYLNDKSSSGFIDISAMFFQNFFFDENNGFIQIPNETAPQHGTVYIIIPTDSSIEESRRADKIIIALSKKYIPYERTESIDLDFTPETNGFLIQKINVALAGRAPVVIINGWILSSPTPDEVLQQYYNTK